LTEEKRRKQQWKFARERLRVCSARDGIRVRKLIKMEWVGYAPSLGKCVGLVEKPEVINREIVL